MILIVVVLGSISLNIQMDIKLLNLSLVINGIIIRFLLTRKRKNIPQQIGYLHR